MEDNKDSKHQQIDENNRNALVYIEAISNNILVLHWRIYKFFRRNKSNTYTNLHNMFTSLHNDASKDSQKVGVAGTGFFVAPDLLVTNIHVVARAKSIAAKQLIVKRKPVYHPDHKDFPIAYNKKISKDPILYTIEGVAASDASNDLVLLKVNEKSTTHLNLANSENVNEGEEAYTLAYANAEYKCVEGIISGRNEKRWFRIESQYTPGYSGSPVLNSNGKIIGIACLMGQRMNDGVTNAIGVGSVIPSNLLNSLLEKTENIESFTAWQKRPEIRAYTLSGQAQMKQAKGKNRSAIAKYNRMLKLNPDIVIAYTNRGGAKSALGDYIGAIKDYDEVIHRDSDYTTAYYNRGIAKGLLGESKVKKGKLVEARQYYQTAIDDYTEVIRQDPKRSMAYNNRGWTLYLLGQVDAKEGNETAAERKYQDALCDVNEAFRLQPEDDISRSSYYHTRGTVKAALGDHEGAITDFNECIRLRPKKALYYQDRGLSKEALGQQEAAEADFAKAKELDPKIEK